MQSTNDPERILQMPSDCSNSEKVTAVCSSKRFV